MLMVCEPLGSFNLSASLAPLASKMTFVLCALSRSRGGSLKHAVEMSQTISQPRVFTTESFLAGTLWGIFSGGPSLHLDQGVQNTHPLPLAKGGPHQPPGGGVGAVGLPKLVFELSRSSAPHWAFLMFPGCRFSKNVPPGPSVVKRCFPCGVPWQRGCGSTHPLPSSQMGGGPTVPHGPF